MQVQDGLELFPKPLGHHHILGSHPLEQQVVAGNHQHHPNHQSSLTMVTGQTRLDEHTHSQHYNAHLQQQSNRIDEEDEDCEDTEEEEDGESDDEDQRMVKNEQQQQSNPWQNDFSSGRQEYNSNGAPTYEQFERAHFGGNDFNQTYASQNNNGQSSNGQGDREANRSEKNANIANNGDAISSPDGVTYYSQFPTPESGSENGGMISSSTTATTVPNDESLQLQLVPLGRGTTTMASSSSVGLTPSGGLVESETYFAERRRTYSFLSPNHTNSNSNSSTSSSSSSTSTNEPTSFGSTFAQYNGTGSDSAVTTAAATSNRNYVMMQSSIINQSNHYHHHYHHYHYYCPNMHQPYHHHHPLLPPPPPPHPSLHGSYNASHPASSTSPTLSSGSSSSMGPSTAAPSSMSQLGPPALPPPGGAVVPLHLQGPTAYPALPWHTNTNHHLQSGQSTSNAYHNGNGYLNGHHQQGPFDDDQSMTSVSNLSYPESPKCKYINLPTFPIKTIQAQ